MKKTFCSEKKVTVPILVVTTGKLAERFWFVSSFVLSLLPGIIAIFSLKIDGPMPMEIS